MSGPMLGRPRGSSSSILCRVCQLQDKKYLCPRCRTPYCSVACYKTHQDNCQPTAPEEDPARDLGGQSSLIYTEDEAVVVPQEHLERLAHSAELKRVLANPELRRFLTFINTTHNPKGFMNLAMQEPLFLEFANICLKVLHPELNEVDELSLEQVQEIVQETIEQAQEDA